jgi:Tol biopolymer transport system component
LSNQQFTPDLRVHRIGGIMSPDILPGAVRPELDRILASATFRGAERSRTLLRFIVEEALQGRADRLKDYTLGSEALGRGETFDPRTDPVARVEAMRLRSRLDVYYATEGVSDPVRIVLPKGGYAPLFESRADVRRLSTAEEQRSTPLAGRRSTWTSTVRWGAAACGLALIAGVVGWLVGRGERPAAVAETRLDLVTPSTVDSVSLAVSPEGRRIVFVANAEGPSRLWIRPIDEEAPRPLPGTDGASLPFWAPDGGSIGFFADGRVKRIDLDTGLIRPISTALVPAGAAWNRDGVILHPIVPDSALFRTSADGAPLMPATQLAPGQTGHRGPAFLADGHHFLFHASGDPAASGIYVGELGTMAARRLLEADAPAVLAAPEHILFVRDASLFIHRIDPETITLIGEPLRLAEGISVAPLSGIVGVSASSDRIAYRTGTPAGRRQFVWVDRRGHEVGRIGSPESAGPSYASASPDWQHLAVQRTKLGNTDVAIVDVDRGAAVRFTTDLQPDIAPNWSPGGDRIVYASVKDGVFQLLEKPLAGGGPRVLLDTPQSKQVTDWSRDGRYLLFRTTTHTSKPDMDIWALPLQGEGAGKPIAIVRTPYDERDAQFSPDNSFIAYQSNESGQFEIYVKSFRHTGQPARISRNGGVQVRWRADGRELFYLTLDGEMTAVPIALASDGRSLRTDPAVPLFHAKVGPVQGVALPSYIAWPDGQFLIDTVIEETPSPLRVISNWDGQEFVSGPRAFNRVER